MHWHCTMAVQLKQIFLNKNLPSSAGRLTPKLGLSARKATLAAVWEGTGYPPGEFWEVLGLCF
ncbi:MAG TPA: hypothetical protein VJK50_03940 [Patescibacteria group bacterium]|nr:hypothetical protein [Patescibacteria group bacterium]